MTGDQCKEIYQELAQMMGEYHMEWVVEGVEEEFRTGEAISYKDLDTDMKFAKMPSRQMILFPWEETTIDLLAPEVYYTPQKRLETLIAAIERAVVNVNEVEDYVTGFFKKHTNADEINLLSAANDKQLFVLRRKEVIARRQQANQLKALLNTLRAQIHQEGGIQQ